MQEQCGDGSAVISPCVRQCQLDARRNHCIGCGRTLDEIARWGDMGSAERLAILRALSERG
jgi:uncharacterized protein